MSVAIDEGIARRVLEVVDAGLVDGIGEPIPGRMCVEAAVCYALGLPHGDDPACVAPAIRWLMIRLNDARWSSIPSRAKGLRRLAIAQLGSAGVLDEIEFVSRVARLAIQTCVPTALRVVAQCHAGEQQERLLHAADQCEREPTREHALEARATAYACAADAAADADAYYAADADAYYAADAAAHAAAYADAAAYAAADAAVYAAGRAADAAVYAAGRAAAASADAADAAYDDALAAFAERVVQVLIDMGSPGAAYLYLTESAT